MFALEQALVFALEQAFSFFATWIDFQVLVLFCSTIPSIYLSLYFTVSRNQVSHSFNICLEIFSTKYQTSLFQSFILHTRLEHNSTKFIATLYHRSLIQFRITYSSFPSGILLVGS